MTASSPAAPEGAAGPSSRPFWERRLGLPLFGLLALVGLSYANALYSPLVLDDFHSFVEAPELYLKDFSLASFRRLAETSFGYTRAVPLALFAIDHWLAPGHVVQYHLTNILIHLLAAASLAWLLAELGRTPVGRSCWRFFPPRLVVLFAVGLWAAHPVQTNAVTYLVQRMAALAGLFYFLACACYLAMRRQERRGRRAAWLLALALAAILGLLSKENIATLPVALLLLEGLFVDPTLAQRVQRAVTWRRLAGVLVIAALLLPLAAAPWQAFTEAYALRHFTMAERLFTELRVVVLYLSLLALPLPGRMNLDHDIEVSRSLLQPPTTLAALVVLVALAASAWRLRRQMPVASFGIAWLFLNLIIESSVLPLELAFEHRLYLPSAGL
ncbi:MAG: hypothetical protein AB1634_08940, partial [Thermodesulfobacteriota bacterium]